MPPQSLLFCFPYGKCCVNQVGSTELCKPQCETQTGVTVAMKGPEKGKLNQMLISKGSKGPTKGGKRINTLWLWRSLEEYSTAVKMNGAAGRVQTWKTLSYADCGTMRRLRTHLTIYKARLHTGQGCMHTFIYKLKETRKRTGERAHSSAYHTSMRTSGLSQNTHLRGGCQ